MINNKQITWITLSKSSENDVYICYIEDFGDELKEKIREVLNSIWHGSKNYQENQDIYEYKNTLRDFLNRYNNQSPNTKKGIIGELLTHILIPKYIVDFEVISIMKNKEERSIKKGFDIVYSNNVLKNIWYCEVKSGGDEDTLDINDKNSERLDAAKKGIQDMFDSNRTTLWDSVLNDVNLTIFNSKEQINIKQLLKADHPNSKNRNMDRNVILSSVLYKTLDKKICPLKLDIYKSSIDKKSIFVGLILFSIQKPTYKKIEDFLVEEANNQNDW